MGEEPRIGTGKPGPGRDTKLTPELQEQICDKIRHGNYVEIAVRACGISRATFYNWLKWGNAYRNNTALHTFEEYSRFLDAVEAAEADAEALSLARLAKFAEGDPKVDMWRLERKHAERWGKKDTTTLKGDAEAPVTVKILDAVDLSKFPKRKEEDEESE